MKCIKTYLSFFKLWPQQNKKRYYFDLQLFSQEKTEEATPKKRQDARKKGQVAKSTELNSAFIVLAAFGALNFLGPHMYLSLDELIKHCMTNLPKDDLTIQSTYNIFLQSSLILFKIAMPIMILLVVVGFGIGYMQVGSSFSTEPIMPQLSRINPISGFARIFSKRALFDLAKSICKIIIISYFIYRFIANEAINIPNYMAYSLGQAFSMIGTKLVHFGLQIGGVILFLAIIDYAYQVWEHNESIKMSKQEVKEEYKQVEGNPQLKGKIKEKQRAMAMQRMMQEVPNAAVVITNPTHFAVALKYDKELAAPIVIAKGADFIAMRIKEIAKENDVAIVENKQLARSLFANVEINDTIPPELYQAVAQVLAYVYKLKNRLS